MSQPYEPSVPGPLRTWKRSSVLGHDRPQQLQGVAMGGQLRERRGYLGVAAINGVQYRLDAAGDACPSRRIRSSAVAPVAAARVWPVCRRSWNWNPGMPALRRARLKAWQTASPPIGRPSRPTNTRSGPATTASVAARR
jgi:hypothetical protein